MGKSPKQAPRRAQATGGNGRIADMRHTKPHVLSIRRLVAGTLVLVCIVVNALVLHYVSQEHKLVEETVTTTNMDQGRAWARLCEAALIAKDRECLQRVVNAIGTGDAVRQATVATEEGIILASTETTTIGNSLSGHDPTRAEGADHFRELHPSPSGFFHESGHNFEFFYPLTEDGKPLGSLLIEINTAWANQNAKVLAVGGLMVAILLTTGMAFAALVLDRRLRRAVKRLIAATQAISRGQLSEQVSVGTGDELDLLGKNVNLMAEALKRSEVRISHWHRQLEKTIVARTQELEASQVLLAQREKMAALGLMAAGVTHEVGNPLAAISAIVQRMERDTSTEFREKCRLVLGEIERVSRVLEEMKQFARPLSRSSELVNVNEVLEISMKTCRYDPRAKDVRMVVDLDPDIPAIRGDGDRWQQVFLNLFNNAFDAMGNGGQLTVASRANNGQVELTIRDTGTGMTAEQLGNLFHPFYSTKSPDQGIGLGLSVCAGIVRSYGGRIKVKSAVGRGTQFRIIVPVPQPKKGAGKPMSGLSPASQAQRESPT